MIQLSRILIKNDSLYKKKFAGPFMVITQGPATLEQGFGMVRGMLLYDSPRATGEDRFEG